MGLVVVDNLSSLNRLEEIFLGRYPDFSHRLEPLFDKKVFQFNLHSKDKHDEHDDEESVIKIIY